MVELFYGERKYVFLERKGFLALFRERIEMKKLEKIVNGLEKIEERLWCGGVIVGDGGRVLCFLEDFWSSF